MPQIINGCRRGKRHLLCGCGSTRQCQCLLGRGRTLAFAKCPKSSDGHVVGFLVTMTQKGPRKKEEERWSSRSFCILQSDDDVVWERSILERAAYSLLRLVVMALRHTSERRRLCSWADGDDTIFISAHHDVHDTTSHNLEHVFMFI